MEINNNKSELLGIFSIVFAFLYPPIGLLFGIVGLFRSKLINKAPKTLNIIGIIISLIMIPVFMMCIL